MRTSFLLFTMVALVASSMTAASAFNWAQTGARSVSTAIVTDENAYLAIAEVDYGCFTDILATGKIDLNFDSGTGCAGTGTGINAGSTYYYHDVLKVTNKGTATLSDVWLNITGSDITIQVDTTQGEMTTDGTYGAAKSVSNLAVGDSIYIGFKLDAASKTVTDATISGSLSVDARSST
jgi:hypothetical protein